jgi:hypothetical protein
MKSSLIVLAIAIFTALIAALLSWNYGDSKAHDDFLSNLFLNLVPEAVGLAATIIGTLYVASRVATSRFTKLAPKVFELLAQFRNDKTISAEATQKAMIVIVPLLDESLSPPVVGDGYNPGSPQNCRVCGLKSKFHKDRGLEKCMTCGLRSDYWRSEVE